MITRERIQELLESVMVKRPDAVKRHMRKLLEDEDLPKTITRGGRSFDTIDYILSDLGSYDERLS